MPEGAEVDTEGLRETMLEPPTDRRLRNIALTTAMLAALGAVAALQAGSTVNEALVLKTESTRLQAEASDQWAYYQAKGLKAAIKEAAGSSWAANGKDQPPEYASDIRRYEGEQKEIQAKARELER